MIDPKELMIGNVVLYRQVEVVITELRTKYAEIAYPHPSTMLDDAFYKYLAPIPLTPSILERCGFVKYYNPEKDHTTEYWDYHGMALIVYSGVIRLQQHGTIIEHLHHLQNIVKNLTGKELEVK